MFGVFWTKKITNRKWKKILIPMSVLYIISFIFLIVLKNDILIYLLPIIYMLIGCGNSAYNLYDNIAIYESSLKGYETSYVTFERFIEGIVTAIIPILTSTLLINNGNKSIKLTFIISLITFSIMLMFISSKWFNND